VAALNDSGSEPDINGGLDFLGPNNHVSATNVLVSTSSQTLLNNFETTFRYYLLDFGLVSFAETTSNGICRAV
jgi:hypothetical protein